MTFSSSNRKPHIIVVGSGVSGLNSAIRLLEEGFPVTIIARDFPPHTTSDVAAAGWHPYQVEHDERILRWGQVTLEECQRLSTVPEAGVSPKLVIQLFDQRISDPWFKSLLRVAEHTPEDALPPGYAAGYTQELPFFDTPVYMLYLMSEFEKLAQRVGGGRICRNLAHISELYSENRPIINCSGVNARMLVDDEQVYPIRGQVVLVRAPRVTRHLVDDEGPRGLVYVFPRSRDCVLGGTAEEGVWNTTPDPAITNQIVQRCHTLEPNLEGAVVLAQKVGLRPFRRGGVRLEFEQVPRHPGIIHNYGHGGAGFTLSAGCAHEVVAIAKDVWS